MATYHEQRDTLDSNVDEEESKGAKVVCNVQHGPLYVVRLRLLVLVGTVLEDEAPRSNHAFALVQKPAFFRAAGHHKGCGKADDNGDEALEEENVSPCVDDHGRGAPWRDTRETVVTRQFACKETFIDHTYAVASRPPNAPAMEAAET